MKRKRRKWEEQDCKKRRKRCKTDRKNGEILGREEKKWVNKRIEREIRIRRKVDKMEKKKGRNKQKEKETDRDREKRKETDEL